MTVQASKWGPKELDVVKTWDVPDVVPAPPLPRGPPPPSQPQTHPEVSWLGVNNFPEKMAAFKMHGISGEILVVLSDEATPSCVCDPGI